MTLTKEYFH
ncbi:hypothetical protein MXB_5550 [Myxobolus squamalis]|nr:hypothetical protein MXB_5550 [Myxobolus squamalis]